MQITAKMVNELNAELKKMGCAFKYTINKDFLNGTVIERVPVSNMFILNSIINCTPDFYAWLEEFLKARGITKVHYNNTGSMCWSEE